MELPWCKHMESESVEHTMQAVGAKWEWEWMARIIIQMVALS